MNGLVDVDMDLQFLLVWDNGFLYYIENGVGGNFDNLMLM